MSLRIERFTDDDLSPPRPNNRYNPFSLYTDPGDFSELQQLLAEELSASSFYAEAWRTAEQAFQQKRQSSPQFFRSSIRSECYIAVIAYTLDEPCLCDDFKKKFRQLTDKASWEEFPYKSFFYLLVLSKDGVVHQPHIHSTLYRGISSHLSPEPRVGDWFYFDYFASCSADPCTAETFAGSWGTIIELQGGVVEGIGIRNYSSFVDENEVLVFPNNKFKVVKFEKDGRQHRLVLEKVGVEDGFL